MKKYFNRHPKLLLTAALFLGVAAVVVDGRIHVPLPSSLSGQHNSKIPTDRSVKTEPGKPIVVRRAIDGDTIELVNGDKVRYIGVDTPEEVDARKPVQCFAKAAAHRNQELVGGQVITFTQDVNRHDAYGRWLGFVYLADGTFVNKVLVEEGYAFAYPFPPDVSRAEEFRLAEAHARVQKRGLWATCHTHKTRYGRMQTEAAH